MTRYNMKTDRSWLIAEAAERLLHRERKIHSLREQRRVRAREWAFQVAAQLGKAETGLEKVIGFGSAFETWRTFREDSDIDLAVIGGDWFRLTRSLPPGEFEVSIVELELQNQEFITHVLTNGQVLYIRGMDYENY